MRRIQTLLVALLALVAAGVPVRAQGSLPISLFERYVEALRQQAGIPGMSAAIVQNGRVMWDNGFGFQDVDALVRATAQTPYPVLDLTQTLSSTVLLHQCLELRYLELSDRVRRWDPEYADDTTTVAQLLSHATPGGGFKYDSTRFAALTNVVDQCSSGRFARVLADELFNRLGMQQSVPGADIVEQSSPNRRWFNDNALARYTHTVSSLAVPYRVDRSGRPTRSDVKRNSLSTATGVVSTVRDLAIFDAALDTGAILDSSTRARAWEPSESNPMGLGWFVQRYNGERVVWHFGMMRDAYSSLIVKVPDRRLTLILLANSDGLAGPPYNLSDGDLTSNLFANLFLKLFVG